MTPCPAVSVVIPTRDRRDLLADALTGVLNQHGVDLEVIVVDDGSTDGTADFLRHVTDPRLRVVRHDASLGVAAARNRGLAEAGAPWVAFTDDDDLWSPHKLAAQLEALGHDGNAGWSCGGAINVNERMRPIRQQEPPASGDVSRQLLGWNVIPGGASGVLADTALARAVGGFDPSFSVFADWDFWIRLSLARPLVAVDRPLHAYRIHPDGMSVKARNVHAELDRIEAKYVPDREARHVEFLRPNLEVWIGDRSQRAGRRLEAASAYLRSVPRISRAKALGKATETLLWPDLYRVRDWHHGRRVSTAWRTEIRSWLKACPKVDPRAASVSSPGLPGLEDGGPVVDVDVGTVP